MYPLEDGLDNMDLVDEESQEALKEALKRNASVSFLSVLQSMTLGLMSVLVHRFILLGPCSRATVRAIAFHKHPIIICRCDSIATL